MRAGPDLRAARTPEAACAAVIEHLAAAGGLLPSIYLERGGRLRCHGAHGYRQVLDGMKPGTGVIGETFRTGQAHRVRSVATDPDYLAAALDIVAEVCVPLRVGEAIVGVVNVESRAPIDDRHAGWIERCAHDLAERLAELGGIPEESKAQRLARMGARLATLTDLSEIGTAVLEAALDVTGMDSGLLAFGGRGRVRIAAASGTLAEPLRALPSEAIAALLELTRRGASLYSVGASGEEFEGIGALHAAGVRAVAAVRLPRGRQHGLLVSVDSRRDAVTTGQVELLELVAGFAAGSLRTAEAMAELSRRASTDSLTGLGHHASFNERLAAERSGESRLAVLLVDVDGFKQINDTDGHQAGDRALRSVASRLSGALRRQDQLFRIGGDEFAAIVRIADEAEALALGERLRTAVAETGLTVSVGVALPDPGESDASVIARADRALYAVKSSGRDGVALPG